jgi:hypothetical protein
MDKGMTDKALVATPAQIFAEMAKQSKRHLSVKLNQISLWLGRLVIAFNNLEHMLAYELLWELINVIEPKKTPLEESLGQATPALERAYDAKINDMIMASMSFGQKLDFLTALSLKKFSDNPKQQKLVHLIAKALSEAEEFRNKMVHSVWSEGFEDYLQVKARTKGRKGLKIQQANANIPLIKEALEAIVTLKDFGLFAMTHDAIVGEKDEQIFQMSKSFGKP